MEYYLEKSTKRIFITDGEEYSTLINYIQTGYLRHTKMYYDFNEEYNIKLNTKVALKLRRLLS